MTTKIETPEKASNFDPEKANQAFEELVGVFQKHHLTIAEILIVFGNLGYTLGASMEGHLEKGPSEEELKRMYYSNPTVGIAMMLQSLTVVSWFDLLEKSKNNNG